jgi:hypothetical protein
MEDMAGAHHARLRVLDARGEQPHPGRAAKARKPRSQGGQGRAHRPCPTHTEIAARVSTHREAVTRELTRLARIGLIEREKNALVVTDLERLAEMVHAASGE